MDEIMDIVLYDILRLEPSMATGVFLTDIVNLIILPTVFLLVFTYYAADKLLKGMDNRFRLILTGALYLAIVSQGWYPMFAQFITNYMMILIFIIFVIFVLTRFIHAW